MYDECFFRAAAYMNIILIVIFSFLITSCATSKQIHTSSGKIGHSIDCSGGALNWGMCYEKAGNLCGKNGYNIINQEGETGAVITGSQYGIYGGSVTYRTLVIECKGEVRYINTSKEPEKSSHNDDYFFE